MTTTRWQLTIERQVEAIETFNRLAGWRLYVINVPVWRLDLNSAVRTETIVHGVCADFDAQGRLTGIEVLDASEVLRHKVQFGVELTPVSAEPVMV